MIGGKDKRVPLVCRVRTAVRREPVQGADTPRSHAQASIQVPDLRACIVRLACDTINAYRQIAYVGDSTNDFCPAMELRRGDVCLARSGMSLDKLLAAKKERVSCDVVVWETYADILACFQSIFAQ